MNIIVDLWRYAEACCHEKKMNNFEFLKKNKLTKQNFTDCFSFISEEKNRVVFAFAGTKDNFKSWIKDFFAFPLSKDSLVHTKTNEPGIIHRGFYELWEKSKPIIDEVLKRSAGKKILVTGMSQGGAVATLCARHLVKNRSVDKNNLILVSFGAPAQGVREYASRINELLGSHFRVVNGYDIVTTMPPEKLGFVHSGSFVWLKAAWWHRFFYRIRAHFWSSYTKKLLKKFTKEDETIELKIVLDRVTI